MVYQCERCGGLIIAASPSKQGKTTEIYPLATEIDDTIPSPAPEYLNQALNSLSSPSGAVMLAASAVDAMLKDKRLQERLVKRSY